MKQAWTEKRDPYVLAPYAYKDRQWVGYDDVESITLKAQYIKAMGLAGGMIWSVETDDFLGKCHNEKYPLLKAINKVFEGGIPPMPTPAPTQRPSHTTPIPSSTSSTEKTWWPRPSSTSTTSRWWPPPSSTSHHHHTTSTTSTTERPTPAEQTTPRQPTRSTKWPWAPTHAEATTRPTKVWTTTKEPLGPGKLICKETGMHRHPDDCKKFYQCVGTRKQGEYRIYEYKCPDETVFDLKTKRCTWPKEVPECNKYFKRRHDGRRSHGPRRITNL